MKKTLAITLASLIISLPVGYKAVNYYNHKKQEKKLELLLSEINNQNYFMGRANQKIIKRQVLENELKGIGIKDTEKYHALLQDFDAKRYSQIRDLRRIGVKKPEDMRECMLALDYFDTMKERELPTAGQIANAEPRAKKYSEDIIHAVEENEDIYSIDPLLELSQIGQESGFRHRATSYVGAKGLLQLMSATAKEMGVTNPYNPRNNLIGGTKYLAKLLRENGGDLLQALAAYNAGKGNVRIYKGVPPFRETKRYVRGTINDYIGYINGKKNPAFAQNRRKERKT
jgi:soluble lytic murein transglycosylase-like protein